VKPIPQTSVGGKGACQQLGCKTNGRQNDKKDVKTLCEHTYAHKNTSISNISLHVYNEMARL
jgi:hypothetical protein